MTTWPALDELEAALAAPERSCEWCLARPGEWCHDECAAPTRRCSPARVAQYAADNGASSDEDAALIVAAINLAPKLIAVVRAVEALADTYDQQARDMELVRSDAVTAKPSDPATLYADSVARNVAKEWGKVANRLREALAAALGDLT